MQYLQEFPGKLIVLTNHFIFELFLMILHIIRKFNAHL